MICFWSQAEEGTRNLEVPIVVISFLHWGHIEDMGALILH